MHYENKLNNYVYDGLVFDFEVVLVCPDIMELHCLHVAFIYPSAFAGSIKYFNTGAAMT